MKLHEVKLSIIEAGLEAGLDRICTGPAVASRTAARFHAWLDSGLNAGMAYLERDALSRADPRRVWPGARSVIAAALGYRPAGDPPLPTAARYARWPDYHPIVSAKLEALVRAARRAGGEARAFVDTGPLLERGLAAEAGLGWIGKNTCLVAPGTGSWCFIGIVLTDLVLDPDPYLEPECGDCKRCLDACPTGALIEPYVLDARRCLSYQTIENRASIPAELRPAVRTSLLGCDRCQEVCPANDHAAAASVKAYGASVPAPDLAAVLALDEEGFRSTFKHTCFARPGRIALVRNAALVAANLRLVRHRPVLERLAVDPDPLIREHAAWAMARLRAQD